MKGDKIMEQSCQRGRSKRIVCIALLVSFWWQVGAAHGQQVEFEQITAPMPQATGEFGQTMDTDGQVLIVGEPGPFTSVTSLSGEAHIYRRVGASWVHEAELIPTDMEAGARFGTSVAIDGDVAAVGARLDDNGVNATGSVYVYRYDGTQWNLDAQLIASDAGFQDRAGRAISLDGNTLLMSCDSQDTVTQTDIGSFYVFRYNGSSWIEEQQVFPVNPVGVEKFSWGISHQGDIAVIGAPSAVGGNPPVTGAVYMYREVGGTWIEEAVFRPTLPTSLFQFGVIVKLAGPWAFVRDIFAEDAQGDRVGAVYVYRRGLAGWTQETILMGAGTTDLGWFGFSIDVEGDRAIIGAPLEDNALGVQTGRTFLYRYDGTNWLDDGELTGSDLTPGNRFGTAVAITSSEELVGAPLKEASGVSEAGRVYRYVAGQQFIRGDVNGDLVFDLPDVLFNLNYLFANGPAPNCFDAADANDDDFIDLVDPTYSIWALFQGGPPPPAPTNACGLDPGTSIGCVMSPCP